MAIVRPSSDIVTGGWSSTGSTLYETIDETTASDADYISSSTSGQIARIALGSTTDPGVDTGHVLRYRAASDGDRGLIARVVETGSFPFIVPRKQVWTQQPQVPVEVDWSNPLTRGLLFAHTPQSNLQLPARVDTRAGVCASFDPAVSFNIDTKVKNSQVDSHAAFIVVRHPLMNSSRLPNYMGCRVSENNGWAFYQNSASGSYPNQTMGLGYAHGGVAAYGFATTGVNGTNINYTPLGFSATVSGNLSLYVYGKSVYSTTIGAITQSNDTIRVGRDVFFNLGPGDYETPLFAYWNRRLSGAEHASLSDNPYQIFRPIRKITYVDLGRKVIAERTPTLTASPADYTIDLTSGEAATITDYSALALEVEST